MAAELTIEQLAAESGMTVRNIRAHQARGLIAPPEVRMRVGYYGPEQVAALRLIRELQADGFNLAAIQRLLSDRERTEERLARFRTSLSQQNEAEAPQSFTPDQLSQRFRLSAEEAARVLGDAERLGLITRAIDGTFTAPRPSLLDVAEEVVTRGISLGGVLAVYEEITRHCDEIATAFVRLFVADVWRQFEAEGLAVDGWPEIERSIDRLRAVATDAVGRAFGQRLDERIDSAFAPGRARRLAPPHRAVRE